MKPPIIGVMQRLMNLVSSHFLSIVFELLGLPSTFFLKRPLARQPPLLRTQDLFAQRLEALLLELDERLVQC
jgi:hypothetical protein